MRTWVAVALAVAGVGATAWAVQSVMESRLFDGCDIHLVSEASDSHAWRVTFDGTTHEGTLAPRERETVDVCWLAPRDGPIARVTVGALGNATFAMDAYCTDPEVLVRDDAVVLGARSCG